MFRQILVALDGSSYSELVLPAAIEVAKKFDSEIVVLHASEHDRGRAVVYSLESPADATMLVTNSVKAVREAGIVAKGKLVDVASGHVAKAIVETAEANNTDLIVMGSRGLSDVQGLLLGSVTHKVIQTAGAPVLVVKPARRDAPVAASAVGVF